MSLLRIYCRVHRWKKCENRFIIGEVMGKSLTHGVVPNSHRPPDTTRRSCLCRVWSAGVNWTTALNVFRLRIFRRRQSSVVGNPIHTVAEADADTDKTVLSRLAWRCEWAVSPVGGDLDTPLGGSLMIIIFKGGYWDFPWTRVRVPLVDSGLSRRHKGFANHHVAGLYYRV